MHGAFKRGLLSLITRIYIGLSEEYGIFFVNNASFLGVACLMVGTARFELATPCPPDKYATRLRYAPNAPTECAFVYYKSEQRFVIDTKRLFLLLLEQSRNANH